jgi:hypothetical protein
MTATMIRTKRVDATTTVVIRPHDQWGRTFPAGWVHTGPDGTYVGQLAAGCNPARNTRIFHDMGEAVQWVWENRLGR